MEAPEIKRSISKIVHFARVGEENAKEGNKYTNKNLVKLYFVRQLRSWAIEAPEVKRGTSKINHFARVDTENAKEGKTCNKQICFIVKMYL